MLKVLFWIFSLYYLQININKYKPSLQCMSQLNMFDIFMKRSRTSQAAAFKLNIDSNDLFFGAARVWILIKRREMRRILNFKKTLYRALGKFNGNVIDLLGSSFMKQIPMNFFKCGESFCEFVSVSLGQQSTLWWGCNLN